MREREMKDRTRGGAVVSGRLCASVSLWLCVFCIGAPGFGADGPAPVPLPVAEVKRDAPVDFEKEILPILSANCLACHNRTKSKADLVLETPSDMLKGGESRPAVVPRNGEQSLILNVAAHR